MLDTEFAVPTFFKLLPFIFTISLSVISVLLSEFLLKLLINNILYFTNKQKNSYIYYLS